MSITETLKTYPTFQSFSYEKQVIFARLAAEFEDNDLALHLSPTELTEKLQIGNRQLWQEFLQLDPVKLYIKSQMAFNSQIASRKTLSSLQKEALLGNTTAARQINELSGILNQDDNNKVVVLHQIQRSHPNHDQQPQQTQAN